ncbi:unnamed protein product, partial [Musa textilis]
DHVPLYAKKVGPFHDPRSIPYRGSTGIFIFFYCIYYYHPGSDMLAFYFFVSTRSSEPIAPFSLTR